MKSKLLIECNKENIIVAEYQKGKTGSKILRSGIFGINSTTSYIDDLAEAIRHALNSFDVRRPEVIITLPSSANVLSQSIELPELTNKELKASLPLMAEDALGLETPSDYVIRHHIDKQDRRIWFTAIERVFLDRLNQIAKELRFQIKGIYPQLYAISSPFSRHGLIDITRDAIRMIYMDAFAPVFEETFTIEGDLRTSIDRAVISLKIKASQEAFPMYFHSDDISQFPLMDEDMFLPPPHDLHFPYEAVLPYRSLGVLYPSNATLQKEFNFAENRDPLWKEKALLLLVVSIGISTVLSSWIMIGGMSERLRVAQNQNAMLEQKVRTEQQHSMSLEQQNSMSNNTIQEAEQIIGSYQQFVNQSQTAKATVSQFVKHVSRTIPKGIIVNSFAVDASNLTATLSGQGSSLEEIGVYAIHFEKIGAVEIETLVKREDGIYDFTFKITALTIK